MVAQQRMAGYWAKHGCGVWCVTGGQPEQCWLHPSGSLGLPEKAFLNVGKRIFDLPGESFSSYRAHSCFESPITIC